MRGDVNEGAALEKEIEGRDVTQRGGAMIVADREGVAFAGEGVESEGSWIAGATSGEQHEAQQGLEEALAHWGEGFELTGSDEALEVGAEGGGDVVAEEAEVDVGFDEVELVADVMALAIEAEAMEGFLRHKRGHGVGELEFAAFAGGDFFEVIEDGGREDVAGADGEAGGSGFGSGFFDEAIGADDTGGDFSAAEDAVAADFFGGDFLECDGGTAVGFDEVGELAGERAGGVGGGGDGIAEEDGEWFIADVISGVEDGIAKASHFGLPDVVDAGEIVEGSEGAEFL
jgi:hypothetical protein